MKSRDDLRRNFSRSGLDRLRADHERAAEHKRLLAQKIAASGGTKNSVEPQPEASTIEVLPVAEEKLPAVRLYHRSDLTSEVQLVAAADNTVAAIAQALIARNSQVIMAWPDKVNRPLALTIAALLRAQSAEPRLNATVAYYPFSERSTFGLRSIFLNEEDIAARYQKLIVGMNRSEYGTIIYKYAYLLKGLRSAAIAAKARSSPGGSRPNLREMLPIFRPKGNRHGDQYGSEDPDFLGEISSKRMLIREASAYRKEIASIDTAPIAIFGLPDDVDDINRCFRSGTRLWKHCDLIVANASDVAFGQTSAWLKRFRRLRHLAANHQSQPVIVAITSDPFIAKAVSEILNDDQSRGSKANVKTEPQTFIKTTPIDFSAQPSVAVAWKPVHISIHLKEQRLSEFRNKGLALAADLKVGGYPEAADAVSAGVTYVRTIACLPIGLELLRKHLDVMEETGAISKYTAAPYRHLHINALLERASKTADNFGDRVLHFRETVAQMTNLYARGSEVTELVHGLVEKATRKANRTIIALRDRVILHAFNSWLYEQNGIDHEKIAHKLLLTTSDALGSTLSAAARGAPIDTLLVVHPRVKDFGRVIMSAVLPRKLALIADAGSIGSLHGLLFAVHGVLKGEPAQRVDTVLAGLEACKSQFGEFDFDKVITPELKPEMTLDFTVQEAGENAYTGPVVELLTDDGYRLRLLPQTDCLVRQDDDVNPLKMVSASGVKRDDRIFVFTHDLHDRLESLIGPVQTTGSTLLGSYHNAVHDRVALIAGSKRDQAREIAGRMKLIAEKRGDSADLGVHELANVLRWMSAGRVDGRPDAPRSQRTYGLFMEALGIPEIIAAQYWHNGVVSTRVMAIQAGLHAHGRAQEFVLNPEAFYLRYPAAKPELRQLWEEMVRSASVVVDVRLLRPEGNLEDVQ